MDIRKNAIDLVEGYRHIVAEAQRLDDEWGDRLKQAQMAAYERAQGTGAHCVSGSGWSVHRAGRIFRLVVCYTARDVSVPVAGSLGGVRREPV